MNDRRNQILEKAFELYLLKGYSGVSVSVLAEELGIGCATMYYYFQDKEELFRAVIQRYYLDPRTESLNVPNDVVG
ncbi:MAG: TetR/AcrR family transcriptional regulator [Paludibacter sp.]|nr:TetR/AcrR family transcriptional regulator [Bacteroidales bacterium]MCM1068942.1 TetR/AcrR family transcriptional regulator [Prevotella sp.]MCM1353605.1 TetR/AcrR family transcriptional regulator [Bacteroides sp.]MCM1442046.1 TetR/AcrR family transcriptional regulator [Muribaculum sp.]MCM1481498.1 TetR/AcrR family transcriptional regulator [Paludibacter sp.]